MASARQISGLAAAAAQLAEKSARLEASLTAASAAATAAEQRPAAASAAGDAGPLPDITALQLEVAAARADAATRQARLAQLQAESAAQRAELEVCAQRVATARASAEADRAAAAQAWQELGDIIAGPASPPRDAEEGAAESVAKKARASPAQEAPSQQALAQEAVAAYPQCWKFGTWGCKVLVEHLPRTLSIESVRELVRNQGIAVEDAEIIWHDAQEQAALLTIWDSNEAIQAVTALDGCPGVGAPVKASFYNPGPGFSVLEPPPRA